MKWEAGKEYRTRIGDRARIYATDGREPWVIHGAILYTNMGGWDSATWRQDGKILSREGLSPNDLIPPTREVWLWETQDGSLSSVVCSSEDNVHAYVQNNFKDQMGRPVLFREVVEGDRK